MQSLHLVKPSCLTVRVKPKSSADVNPKKSEAADPLFCFSCCIDGGLPTSPHPTLSLKPAPQFCWRWADVFSPCTSMSELTPPLCSVCDDRRQCWSCACIFVTYPIPENRLCRPHKQHIVLTRFYAITYILIMHISLWIVNLLLYSVGFLQTIFTVSPDCLDFALCNLSGDGACFPLKSHKLYFIHVFYWSWKVAVEQTPRVTLPQEPTLCRHSDGWCRKWLNGFFMLVCSQVRFSFRSPNWTQIRKLISPRVFFTENIWSIGLISLRFGLQLEVIFDVSFIMETVSHLSAFLENHTHKSHVLFQRF